MTMKDLLLEYKKTKEDLSNKEDLLAEQKTKIQKLAHDNILLKEAIKLLKQSKFGAKSEKLPPLEEQYFLFDEVEFFKYTKPRKSRIRY